jgi:hypothetical protein
MTQRDTTAVRVTLVALLAAALLPAWCAAQEPDPDQQVFGIWIDAGGVIRYREKDARAELAKVRAAKKPSPAKAPAPDQLHYVSLRNLIGQVKSLTDAGKPLPIEVRCLGGLTQVRYLLVYPQEKDLVLAGPAEPIDADNALQPRGKLSGRPVIQLDDLAVALRREMGGGARQVFGCSIDPPADAVTKAEGIMKEVGSRDRKRLARALSEGMGAQQVRCFGAPADSRLAFVCVAADYQLKRYMIALDPVPIAGVGHPIDSSRPAGHGFWFETLYEPLLVSADGDAYEIRGPRLQVKAGAIPFDTNGATERGKAWAKRLTDNIGPLAAANPLFADLQNIADLSLVAGLIRADRLRQKSACDLSWLIDEDAHQVRVVPVPRSCDTLVHFVSASVAAGGVSLSPDPWTGARAREVDRAQQLEPARQQGLLRIQRR